MSRSLLRHIDALNTCDLSNFMPWELCGQRMGFLKFPMVEVLKEYPQQFAVSPDRVIWLADELNHQQRSDQLDKIVRELVDSGVIRQYMGEPYPITPAGREQTVAVIDRPAASYFGVRTFGQHINGYVREGDQLKIWVARRAADRLHFPNKLDNIVAGGLPYHLGLASNLIKECHEEAAIPEYLASQARACGAITYCRENDVGLKPDTLYCYDLELPETFVPRNTDGEVAEFMLVNAEEVLQWIRQGDEFKLNCNLVFIDFFIRHGVVTPDEPDYLQLVSGLHR